MTRLVSTPVTSPPLGTSQAVWVEGSAGLAARKLQQRLAADMSGLAAGRISKMRDAGKDIPAARNQQVWKVPSLFLIEEKFFQILVVVVGAVR